MTIGERIKERRIELGLSQDELAKKVGYKSRSSINKIELSRSLPASKITLMAKALGTTESNLMGWEDAEKAHENRVLAYYNALSDTNKEMIVGLMRQLGENHEN